MPTLFDPIRIGDLELTNRIIMAPLTRCRAEPGRVPGDLMVEYYRQRADAGLIISEATSVTPMGVGYPDTPGIWSAEQVQGWKKITDAVHAKGGKIVLQLLVPFVAGQFARRWIGAWVTRNKGWLTTVDQGSILLVVYTAFSDAVVEGLWQLIPLSRLLALTLVCCLLLAIVLWATHFLGKRLGFNLEDRITILFAASKKSMATGVPMAQVLFATSAVGTIILPLMIFHQIQLMVCAVLAQRYAQREEEPEQLPETAAP